MERMTPSMDCSDTKESIDGVIRSIPSLFNDSVGRNMPRVLTAHTDLPAHRAPATRCLCVSPITGPQSSDRCTLGAAGLIEDKMDEDGKKRPTGTVFTKSARRR